ncbi:ATP-binding protein [Streptomyces scopuliridis]|uniref:ATP-binding protein n=1 Tax=Streptomyces scopuliridis TaxID=452529 RepID=UPI00369A2772
MSQGPGGQPAASSGEPLPTRPEDTFAPDLDQGAILVLPGPALSQENTQLLGPFVTQLRLQGPGIAAADRENILQPSSQHRPARQTIRRRRPGLATIAARSTEAMHGELTRRGHSGRRYDIRLRPPQSSILNTVVAVLRTTRTARDHG